MKAMLSFSQAVRIGTLVFVSGCMLVMVGCSSALQTMMMSKDEPPSTPDTSQEDSVAPEAVSAAQKPDQPATLSGIPPMDIPVEEPARPTLHPSAPAAIFATPRTDGDSMGSGSFEAPLDAEPVPSSPSALADVPDGTSRELSHARGIPPLSFEPEQPALPTIEPEQPDLDENKQEQEGLAGHEPEQPAVPTLEREQEDLAGHEPDQLAPSDLKENPAPQEDRMAQAESGPTQERESHSSPGSSPEGTAPVPGQPAPGTQEPVQMAKAAPGAPESMERRMEESLQALQDVYFEYDRFTVSSDAIEVLQQNAQALLSGLSGKSLVIEGHCDERGTESYNMVLGERRANAVKKVLVDLGVPDDRLQAVSYGKEKPFCTEQNEQCWQENRRGHFVFK